MRTDSYYDEFVEGKTEPLHKGKLIDLDDMLDLDYLDPELPDDFMYDEISSVFKEDNYVMVMKESLIYKEQELSRVCVVDIDTHVIHVSPKRITPPHYLPKEDFRSTEMMLDWFDRYRIGIREDLPDLPAPIPIIPENQYMRPAADYAVEKYVSYKGGTVCDPSLGFIKEDTDLNMCQLQKSLNLVSLEKTLEIYQRIEESNKDKIKVGKVNRPFFFFPYADVDIEKYKILEKIDYVSMQFNPFHPMAVHSIISFEWDESLEIVSGLYKHRNKEMKFTFNINDQRYRIHSHIWLQVMRGHRFSGAMEVFDFVGNFPFNDRLDLKPREVFVEPLIIEPLCIRGKMLIPDSPVYSYLGNGNFFDRGISNHAVCPYANIIMSQFSLDTTWAIDITEEVVIDRDKLIYNGTNYDIKKKELQSKHIFLKWYDKGQYRVYERVRRVMEETRNNETYVIYETSVKQYLILKKDEESFIQGFVASEKAYKFTFMPIKFFSFPRNMRGTLVSDFRTILLIDAVIMDSSTLHEYWPYLVPYAKENDLDLTTPIPTQMEFMEELQWEDSKSLGVRVDFNSKD
jgi:hypothetical protein